MVADPVPNPELHLVVARDVNGIIGRGGGLPWHLPKDLKRFKALTMGFPIVMGRLTHESIGRPLPGRLNVVVTRYPEGVHAECLTAPTLEEAIAVTGETEKIFVIGGARLYAAALPRADVLHITEVRSAVEGDVSFPAIDDTDWRETFREGHEADAEHPHAFDFVILERIPGA